MDLVKSKPLVLTAKDEESLYKEITEVLGKVNKNMKLFTACRPLELKNDKCVSFELCDENTRSIVTAIKVKLVKQTINVDHPHIFLLWIPRILKHTSASVSIRCRYLATGDEKAVGRFSLSEAFIFSFGWERSIRMEDAYDHKGLHLVLQPSAPSCMPKAPLGRLVPLWDNCVTAKMRYTEDIGYSVTTADEMRVRTVLTDKMTRGLLRSYMATEFTTRDKEEKFQGPARAQLSDDLPESMPDFTKISPVKSDAMLVRDKPSNQEVVGAEHPRKASDEALVRSGNGVHEVIVASQDRKHNTPNP